MYDMYSTRGEVNDKLMLDADMLMQWTLCDSYKDTYHTKYFEVHTGIIQRFQHLVTTQLDERIAVN